MTTSPNAQAPYNWADDKGFGNGSPQGGGQQASAPQQPRGRHTHKERTYNVNVGVRGNGGGNGGGGNGAGQTASAAPGGRQGDGLIAAIERIEFRNEKDILELAKAVNRLGRELHFIIGMRAEEVQGVLSTYKGKWYTFGASSRVKARLVAMHLKVSAEAAKALGVGALKMAHAFDRHFIKPEQEAKRKRNGKTARREFTIGDA